SRVLEFSSSQVLRFSGWGFRVPVLGPSFSVLEPKNPERRTRAPGETSLFNVGFLPCLAQLEPVERVLHQQLARTLERVILPLRKSLPVLRHEDSPAIGMSGED